ncbi:MAG TPA: hypothetical protein VK067_02635 [Pseudogracilibacillus sp.]|nr:hypothetical protein [Pseudogracilibacillus sp.]
MIKWLWNISKITFLFIACIIFFYMSLRMFHAEYEKHRQNELEEYQQLKVEAFTLETLIKI